MTELAPTTSEQKQFNLIHIDATESVRERNMAYVSEILFVDPSVDDIETILHGLRPGVEARVLDPATPAARQIALALEGFQDLDAVHVIAHGAPGRVNFSAGEWSAATLKDEAEDLAAIGRALAEDGELRLWSCDTGAGAAGAAFIEATRAGDRRRCRGLDRPRRRRGARRRLGAYGIC